MKIKLKCVAIDDEPLALALMKNYIEASENLELINLFEDAISATEFLNNNPVDLLFLDINMPDISGIDLFKSLKNKPMLIFTTAYKNYAFEGFELNAVDYLLKPINYIRFKKSVKKVLDFYLFKTQPNANKEEETSIFVHSEYKLVQINLNDILYIESLEDYIKIFVSNGKMILTLMPLKKMVDKLPPTKFSRIHRSFIVAINKIKTVHSRKVELISGDVLPISETYLNVKTDWKH